MKRQFLGILTMFILLYCVCPVHAEKPFEGYWDQTTVTNVPMPGFKEDKTVKQRIFYKDGMMKMLDVESGEYSIFRFDKGLIWTVKPSEKTYQEMKFSDIEEQMDKAKEAMSKMQDEMKNMPPEQRKMMEKMMGAAMRDTDEGKGFDIKVVATQETKTINGHKCRRVNMIMDNEVISILWLTDKYNLGSNFSKMYQQMNKMQGNLSGDVEKLKGFTILSISSVDLGNGSKVKSETSVVKIVPQSVPDAEFSLPRGLKKIEMKMDWD
ncbi:DUF4412 domain-containing protein [candidate division KSB1 bacterium]|nr:DUF4412 domain-containing protein [candidate division KSB1 bacterium]